MHYGPDRQGSHVQVCSEWTDHSVSGEGAYKPLLIYKHDCNIYLCLNMLQHQLQHKKTKFEAVRFLLIRHVQDSSVYVLGEWKPSYQV